ncbi:LA_2168 family protein [Leptospira stimsonii]|uniref:Alginate export domain-containing protein n=1 Tax=Leptospira stimsonii TaxID=2202203 RepID=A0ABY2MXW9_9LEPT|nr:hypothetical protein [Leptospira stimsonii]TGK13374.1 hypothetical protein EHO98_18755 [Leptospira stimsonii]TGM11607.1 hypothetical protein EHQ90_15425 [Leptospira stimsonii]
MRRFFLYSIFIMGFPILADGKSSGWKKISWFGWGLGSGQEVQFSSEQANEKFYKELRINESVFHGSLDQNYSSERFLLRIQADGFLSSDSKFHFYAGRDLFLEWKNSKLSLALGRISEDLKQSSFRDWADGTDGIVVRADFRQNGKLRVDLFDYYSGYKLFEKVGFRDTILLTKRAQSFSNQDLPASLVEPDQFRNRYRGGLSYRYEIPFLEFGLRFQYLNFENWGRYGNDLSMNYQSSGDRDYLTHSTVDIHWKWRGFSSSLTGIFARGQDKTGWNRIRNAATLPITGEAILLSFGFDNLLWKAEIFGFLPDRDRRKENGEILELGFVGIGSNPSPVFSTNQSLDFYPSAWVTDRGLEKQFTLQSGKRQSAWSGINIEYKESRIRFRLYIASYFYLREDSGSSGNLTCSRDSFQNGYFREALLQSTLYMPTDDENVPLSFFKWSIGGWKSDPETAQREVFFQIQSGVIL